VLTEGRWFDPNRAHQCFCEIDRRQTIGGFNSPASERIKAASVFSAGAPSSIAVINMHQAARQLVVSRDTTDRHEMTSRQDP